MYTHTYIYITHTNTHTLTGRDVSDQSTLGKAACCVGSRPNTCSGRLRVLPTCFVAPAHPAHAMKHVAIKDEFRSIL